MVARFEKKKKGISTAISFLGVFALALVLIIVAYLAYSNIRINQRKGKLDAQIEAIQKEIKALEEKNEELKKGIAMIGDESYVEKVAREELSLQKEGETVVGFILPPEEEKNFWQPKNWWEGLKNVWNWIKNIF